ncbi:MAG: hypothetical protein KDK40_02450 [Chlamydiia bacterium]|nr:hypothetical protein [Chlamydiia bacterium]
MRDGVFLPTDLYLPTDRFPHESPCILVRTPNGRGVTAPLYQHFTKEGYILAVQDTRSCLSLD